MATAQPALIPAQQAAFDALLRTTPAGNLFWLESAPGSGRSTVLRALYETTGGALITGRTLIEALDRRHPHALEESLLQLLLDALAAHEFVYVDDLDVIEAVTRGMPGYPRPNLIVAVLKAVCDIAAEHDKKIIAVGGPAAVRLRGFPFVIRPFEPEDYAALGAAWLGNAAGVLDWTRIHRAAPRLSAHQLKTSCSWFELSGGLDTDRFIAYLEALHLATNVHLDEVQPVDLHDLKGMDDLLASLEANVIVPLENEALAAELQLQPKRGVLLAGPPGTGKTTIGRALAHRLRGRFFLVDGTFISGTPQFYQRIQQIVEAAKQNSAAVLFIDDSDVIFESGQEAGLYRYLLTLLDGLESKSAARVCVILTAMDVANLPPALLRSGRIELWLETRLPGESARRAILAEQLATARLALLGVHLDTLVPATEGLTGADLKRLVGDGKTLYAYDRAKERPLKPITEYFTAALATLRQNKERYAQADARARVQRPQRPQWFDPALAEAGVQVQLGQSRVVMHSVQSAGAGMQGWQIQGGQVRPGEPQLPSTPPPGAPLGGDES